jgi:hypothetical protein
LRSAADPAYTDGNFNLTSGDIPAMTRTPTTLVTAIAIAARAFAWEIPSGAHISGLGPEAPLPRP